MDEALTMNERRGARVWRACLCALIAGTILSTPGSTSAVGGMCAASVSGSVWCSSGVGPGHHIEPPMDSDFDGLTDEEEAIRETNPYKSDSDGDGLPDGIEVSFGLNPKDRDTDGDAVFDTDEILDGTDPQDPNSHRELLVIDFGEGDSSNYYPSPSPSDYYVSSPTPASPTDPATSRPADYNEKYSFVG
jgi:hypothetical protein